MRHATALGLKLAVYLVIFGIAMPVWGAMMLQQSMILAAVLTLLLWFSDLVILPRFGNVVATAVDFLTLVLMSPVVAGSLRGFPNPLGLLLAMVAGTAFEWWFHRWLASTGIVE